MLGFRALSDSGICAFARNSRAQANQHGDPSVPDPGTYSAVLNEYRGVKQYFEPSPTSDRLPVRLSSASMVAANHGP